MSKFIAVLIVVCLPMTVFADVILLIPKYKETGDRGSAKAYVLSKDRDKQQEYNETTLEELTKDFEGKGYQIDQIKIWIKGSAESSGLTKLLLSLEGEGGMEVILRPKLP